MNFCSRDADYVMINIPSPSPYFYNLLAAIIHIMDDDHLGDDLRDFQVYVWNGDDTIYMAQNCGPKHFLKPIKKESGDIPEVEYLYSFFSEGTKFKGKMMLILGIGLPVKLSVYVNIAREINMLIRDPMGKGLHPYVMDEFIDKPLEYDIEMGECRGRNVMLLI